MKKTPALLLTLFCCLVAFSQQEMIVQGYVYDAKTKQPIEFVNVGIIGKSTGTVSGKSGFFGFTYMNDDLALTDRLQISMLGYEKLNLPLGKWHGLYGEERAEIYLNPETTTLETVTITNEERKYETIGFENLDSRTIGYWKDKKGMGGEIATRIRIKRERTKLLSLNFKISENLSDSLRIRVNIYDYDNKYPGRNILTKPIYAVIGREYGEEIIDLKPYNIIVDEDVVVSLELVEIYGKKLGLALFGSMDKGTSYIRLVSQDEWSRVDGIPMGFWFEISRPKSSKKAKDIRRDNIDSMLLYWDASAASSARNFEEEFELLKTYLRKQKSVNITVVKFAMGFREQKRIVVERRDWEALENYLKNTHYDGDSDFNALREDTEFKGDIAILFSNGLSATSQLVDRFEVPLFAVNTNPIAADADLKDVCRLSGGHYLNLTKMNVDQALRFLSYDLNDNLRYARRSDLALDGDLYGTVTDKSGPLAGAYLNVVGSFRSALSKADGSYVIDAEIGDVLKAGYPGMKLKNLNVEQLGRLDINMESDGGKQNKDMAELTSEAQALDTSFGQQSENAIAAGKPIVKVEQNDVIYVRGNGFDEDLPRLEDALQDPHYMLRYQNAAQTVAAKSIYQEYITKAGMQSVPFIVNSANFFRTRDGRYAKRVLSNLAVLAPNNVKILKTYAFWLDQWQQYKRATEVYETIYGLQPFEAQNRYALAQSQARSGAYQKALDNLRFILINQTEGVDYKEVAEDAEYELRRLLNLHKESLDTTGLPTSLLQEGFVQKVRVVLEWNDPLAAFEIQFVNPQKKFFNWSFDSFTNKSQLVRYRKDGVFMESFEIPKDACGIWQINLRNIGAADYKNPAYLKYTVYINYGTKFEGNRTKVVNLAQLPAKVVLDRFTNKR